MPKAVPTAKDSPQRFEDVVKNVFEEFFKRIKANHGVKELNVLQLFDPLGVPATAYGSTLLPRLESLGAKRGDHAHLSMRAVPSVLDPLDTYNQIKTIVADLEPLDKWLIGYLKKIR